MRLYSVHIRSHGLDPDRDMELVREGFNWAALLITVPWALWHRLWMFALVVAVVMIATGVLGEALALAPELVGLAYFAVAVICGFIGNDVRRSKLVRRGFEVIDMVSAPSMMEAERRFFDRHQDLAAVFAEAG